MSASAIDEHDGLRSWWAAAELAWAANKSSSDSSDLLDRIDYHRQLSAQLPPATHRVLYTASGNTLAAARLDDTSAVIEHKLYWAAVSGIDEARYLTSILNSAEVLRRVAPLQAIGLFGARDFDKNVFHVPIPTYDWSNPKHLDLVKLAAEAEKAANDVDVTAHTDFKKSRAAVRLKLSSSGIASRIEAAVSALLPAST